MPPLLRKVAGPIISKSPGGLDISPAGPHHRPFLSKGMRPTSVCLRFLEDSIRSSNSGWEGDNIGSYLGRASDPPKTIIIAPRFFVFSPVSVSSHFSLSLQSLENSIPCLPLSSSQPRRQKPTSRMIRARFNQFICATTQPPPARHSHTKPFSSQRRLSTSL